MISRNSPVHGVLRCLCPAALLACATTEVACVRPTPPCDVFSATAKMATNSDTEFSAVLQSDECKRLSDIWTREIGAHRQCTRDADCMPTGLRHTHYECTAVNAGWWDAEKDRIAGFASACSRIQTKSPGCCVVSCERSACVTNSQAPDGDYCSADGGAGVCHASARCEMNRERLWCSVVLAPDWGYCVKSE